MGVTVEVEVKVLDGLGRTVSRHFARSNEASEALRHLDVDQMGRMELVPVSQQARLDPSAERASAGGTPVAPMRRSQSRGFALLADHGGGRLFNVTRFRLWILVSISWRVGRAARRSSSARR
jgi:hypothetical protein